MSSWLKISFTFHPAQSPETIIAFFLIHLYWKVSVSFPLLQRAETVLRKIINKKDDFLMQL
jgi:hypothetical protein